jgi:hypothetical protein
VVQLPFWWGAELWEVELAEPIIDAGQVMLAARGRLLRQISAWAQPLMRRYAQACAWRVRDHSVVLLRALGLHAAAETLAEATTLAGLAEAATLLMDAVAPEASPTVGPTVGYVVDAASFALGSMALVKTVPYVAAHAAGCTAGPEGCVEYGQRYQR